MKSLGVTLMYRCSSRKCRGRSVDYVERQSYIRGRRECNEHAHRNILMAKKVAESVAMHFGHVTAWMCEMVDKRKERTIGICMQVSVSEGSITR